MNEALNQSENIRIHVFFSAYTFASHIPSEPRERQNPCGQWILFMIFYFDGLLRIDCCAMMTF